LFNLWIASGCVPRSGVVLQGFSDIPFLKKWNIWKIFWREICRNKKLLLFGV